MANVSVSSCKCCMFVSCVHYVVVLNAEFCTTCSLLMLVEDARGDHMGDTYSRTGLITTLCVLYVSVGSNMRPRTLGCVAMGSALSCFFWARLLVYSAGSGVNRVHVVLSGFSMRLFGFIKAKTLCRYGCIYILAALVLMCVDVMVMSSAYVMT